MVETPTVEASGADGGGGGVVVLIGSESGAVGGVEDMIKPKLTDTKVLETRVLPGLGRRL